MTCANQSAITLLLLTSSCSARRVGREGNLIGHLIPKECINRWFNFTCLNVATVFIFLFRMTTVFCNKMCLHMPLINLLIFIFTIPLSMPFVHEKYFISVYIYFDNDNAANYTALRKVVTVFTSWANLYYHWKVVKQNQAANVWPLCEPSL